MSNFYERLLERTDLDFWEIDQVLEKAISRMEENLLEGGDFDRVYENIRSLKNKLAESSNSIRKDSSKFVHQYVLNNIRNYINATKRGGYGETITRGLKVYVFQLIEKSNKSRWEPNYFNERNLIFPIDSVGFVEAVSGEDVRVRFQKLGKNWEKTYGGVKGTGGKPTGGNGEYKKFGDFFLYELRPCKVQISAIEEEKFLKEVRKIEDILR